MLKLVEELTNNMKKKLPEVESEMSNLIKGFDNEKQAEILAIVGEVKKGGLTYDDVINRFKKWM